MKVLHVVPSFYPAHFYGGPIESVFRLCVEQVKSGCEVRALTTDANGPVRLGRISTRKEVIIPPGVRVRYCSRIFGDSISVSLLSELPKLVQWADVVHLTAAYSFPTIPTLAACRIWSKPIIWSPRGSFMWWRGVSHPRIKRVWEIICKLVMPSGAVLHATSPEEVKASRNHISGTRIVMIPNGVEVPRRFRSVRQRTLRNILFVGRLHPKKGVENLIDSIRLLSKANVSTLRLTIVGSGERQYERSLRERVRRHRIIGLVRFMGFLQGARKWQVYRSSDVLVLPSYSENFGLVVTEALAHGIPVIASRRTPWSMLEKHGCGLWVNNDPQSLATAIGRLGKCDLGKMGMKGRKWVNREYSWSGVAKRMLRLYAELAQD